MNNFFKYCLTSYKPTSKLYQFFNLNASKKACEAQSNLKKLFNLKDRSFYLSASLLGRDFSELYNYDSFKDRYQFTVSR